MKKEIAVRYLMMKVANIIYDTVECGLKDRAESDWAEAEKIVNEYFRWMIGRMTGTPDKEDQYANQYRDWNLSNDCSYEDFEKKLGEYIWKNTQYLRCNLSRPPYGKITFN